MSLEVIMMIAALVLIVLGAFLGLLRGMGRSFLRLAFVLAAFIGSALACIFFLENTVAVLTGSVVERLDFAWLNELKATLPGAYDLLVGLPTAVLAPLVFTVVFLLVSLVLLIIYAIVAAFVLPKKDGGSNAVSRVLGAVIGAAQGLVVTVAILLPIVGLADVAADVTLELEENGQYESETAEVIGQVGEELTRVKSSPIYSLVSTCGGRTIVDNLMKFEVDGESVNLHDEAVNLAELYTASHPFFGKTLAEFGDPQIAALRSMIGDIGDSAVLPKIAGEMLAALATNWGEDKPIFGLGSPAAEGSFAEFMDEVYAAFADSNEGTVMVDLATVADLFEVLVDEGVFARLNDGEALQAKLAEPGVLDALLAPLYANPRTAAIADAAIDLAVSAFLAEALTMPQPGDPNYEEYREMLDTLAAEMNGFTSGMTDDEKIAALSGELENALHDYGIAASSLSDRLIGGIADTMLTLPSDRPITADDIADLFESNAFVRD